MTIFYKAATVDAVLPTSWADIPGLSPLPIRGAELVDAYFAALGLPPLAVAGGTPGRAEIAVRLIGSGAVLAAFTWPSPTLASLPLLPSLCGSGSIVNRGGRDEVRAQWQAPGFVTFRAQGPASLSVAVGPRGDAA